MNIDKSMDRKISLITPVSEDIVRQLQVDDEVFLTGRLFVMPYSWHFTKAIDMARAGRMQPRMQPMNLQNGAIIHSPTSYIETDNDYQIRFIGVTTSSKLNQWTPDIIKFFRIRCIIGKGGMDEASLAAMRKYGCVYLAMPGGCSPIYTATVQALVQEYWLEFDWPDRVLELSVKGLGPLIVAMDSHGRSLYKERHSSVRLHINL